MACVCECACECASGVVSCVCGVLCVCVHVLCFLCVCEQMVLSCLLMLEQQIQKCQGYIHKSTH